MMLPLVLLHPVTSLIDAIIPSSTVSSVDIAAKTMNRKNRVPQALPPAMLLKTVAMVSNSNAGPEVTSRL